MDNQNQSPAKRRGRTQREGRGRAGCLNLLARTARVWTTRTRLSSFFLFFFSKHIVVGRLIVQHTSNTITFIHTSFCLSKKKKKSIRLSTATRRSAEVGGWEGGDL